MTRLTLKMLPGTGPYKRLQVQPNSLIDMRREAIASSTQPPRPSKIEVSYTHSIESISNLDGVVMRISVTTKIQQFKVRTPPVVTPIQPLDPPPELHPKAAEVSFESVGTSIPLVELTVIGKIFVHLLPIVSRHDCRHEELGGLRQKIAAEALEAGSGQENIGNVDLVGEVTAARSHAASLAMNKFNFIELGTR